MSQDGALERDLWAVPPKATAEWLALREVLEKVGPVACQTADPDAWWPEVKDAYATNILVDLRRAHRGLYGRLSLE